MNGVCAAEGREVVSVLVSGVTESVAALCLAAAYRPPHNRTIIFPLAWQGIRRRPSYSSSTTRTTTLALEIVAVRSINEDGLLAGRNTDTNPAG